MFNALQNAGNKESGWGSSNVQLNTSFYREAWRFFYPEKIIQGRWEIQLDQTKNMLFPEKETLWKWKRLRHIHLKRSSLKVTGGLAQHFYIGLYKGTLGKKYFVSMSGGGHEKQGKMMCLKNIL